MRANTSDADRGWGVLLFLFGHAHLICDELTSPLIGVSRVAYSAQSEFRAFPDTDEGSKMVVLCGAFRLEHPGVFSLLHSLPKVIHFPAEQGHIAPWRMHRATRLLKNNVYVEKIAALLGYESEVAFRKAFKQEVGMSPARY